jgi:cholesterol oxidase
VSAAAPPFARGLHALWHADAPPEPFDVLIVGSGYGGSVAAAGLAGCRDEHGRLLRVGVLERGRHWRPGEFPSRFADLPGHIRLARQASGVVHGHEGLLDVRLGDDVVALVANGLGGGSLINAGVMLEPDARDFAADPHWQAQVTELGQQGYFERARCELGGKVWRGGHWVANTIGRHDDVKKKPLDKNQALRRLAAGSAVLEPPITVALDDQQPNSAGVKLPRCTLCGDCLTGCNVGAKDSLDANLLLRAQRNGAELYTGVNVVSIARESNARLARWFLRVAHTDPGLQAREKELLFLRAEHVVLAAGSLGSSEILLRSRSESLSFSQRLGLGFSCNGDNIAAVHRMPLRANCSGDENQPLGRHVGPTITASFAPTAGPRGFVVQEFAVPASLKRIFDEAVTTAHALHTLPDADCAPHGPAQDADPDPLGVDPTHMAHTLLVGLIGHDDAAGALRLPRPVRPREGPAQTGTVTIHWPEARIAPALDDPHRVLQGLAESASSSLIANPLWRLLPHALERLVLQPRGPVLTVHPLGGCGIGDNVHTGVVDRLGRVFDAAGGAPDARHGGLLVLDGAIVPGSLGVNPALTITALAMRAVDALRNRRQWTGDTAFDRPAQPPPRQSLRDLVPLSAPVANPTLTTVEVIERLSGEAWLDIGTSPQERHCMVELTLAYEPVAVRDLLGRLKRTVKVDPDNQHSRLRVYDFDTWRDHHLRVASDTQRHRHALYEAEVEGKLHFLHREPSGSVQRIARSVWPWLRNRGVRDIWFELRELVRPWFDARERVRRRARNRDKPPSKFSYLRALIAVATHAGEVRRFDYALNTRAVLEDRWLPTGGNDPRAEIVGDKRLTYNRRANPWQQLTELTLRRLPGLKRGEAVVLRLDPGFMAGVGVPLLRLAAQRDHASALADLASLGLQFARVLLYTHLWTFRKPDPPRAEEPRRLPGAVGGVLPQVSELVVDRRRDRADPVAFHRRDRKEPVTIRLSRYCPAQRDGRPALVMIHGYSVSGNTFTHDTLRPSAAEYFLDRGREVWVVDLRTSAGLPSATEPWSFEEAALIDLPAALLHIKAVTGERVDVLAHCIGCAMLGMAILSDPREIHDSEQQLGVHTTLTSEHLGLLSVFNGARPKGGPHPTIAHIVLSQKGPVLRYTDANILRAFLMQSLRRVLLSDDFQFRPTTAPTLADELLDRLLSSLPYPKEDYDIENPLWPCSDTSWTTTRHRMDALYGRDFDAANMHPETLVAIDDLFGPINLDTVAQTTHFARFCTITNQAGRGEFVTHRRLRARWRGIPTLAIHGIDNGLADLDTQRLLERNLQAAGVLFFAKTYRDMGHQDVLIGKQSYKVFNDIEQFLSTGRPDDAPPDEDPATQRVVAFDAPWVGPRIDPWPDGAGPPRLRAMPRPDQGTARLVLVPGQRLAAGKRRYVPLDLPGGLVVGESGASGEWLAVQPDLPALAGGDPAAYGFFVLLQYERDETTATLMDPAWPDVPLLPTPAAAASAPAMQAGQAVQAPRAIGVATLPPVQFQDEQEDEPADLRPPPADPAQPMMLAAVAAHAALPVAASQRLARATPLLDGVKAWLRQRPNSVLARCFVRLDDLNRAHANRQPQAPKPDFTFAFGSCQYPHGLIDRAVADRSLAALRRTLDNTQMTLLVGDQIYADATAGLLDATRSDERYDAPHDRALRLQSLRAVMRRVPVWTLPDDHELDDNWEPLSPDAEQKRPRAAEERKKARADGMRAFHRYQRMVRGRDVPKSPPVADCDFVFAGYPFYLLDTRSGRSARGATVAADAVQLIQPEQWERLRAWLLQHRDAVKFVATPALLLPRHRAVADEASAAGRNDGWGGYPHTLHRLLDLIAQTPIRHTVFLSGDEHHALYSEAWLGPGRIKLVSVHSSALYAPFPFANGRPQDLAGHETIVPPPPFLSTARVRTRCAPAGDGFVQLTALDGAPPRLRITFCKADGGATAHEVTLA